ncbi:uncharacterized protein CDV56_104365 [Aspergillus thermomutatus]|uniref:Uncharacterized protein n=1 Tax=Aspergillus thermomutatus TaxID=41047 RepID=A0A397GJ68_ASPTH|nr:uncharacterized protein CDV56_104365 [Aspergillus thermomutatus]RHZ51025.1 hypothetical protein CDV56_104365 [Aspergillus thermomutatus]
MKSKGVEREMRICHTQPHLVPPMKLVVYDDLPSPGPPPRTSSFPSWIMEGRSIASRASNRASMSLKRQSTTPLRISAPTDFRRVETFQSFASSPAEFQPLVLKIHTPGNRLSDLPTFNDFLSQEDQRRSLAWPAKALVSPTDPSRTSRGRSHHHHSSSSFQLPRKPVGSGSRRSSVATLEQLLDKQTPITSPVIPHFSARTSTATGISEALFSPTHTRLESSAGYGSMPQRQRSDINPIAVAPKTPPKTPLQDRPLPALPTDNTPSSTGTSNPSPSTLFENDIPSPTPNPNTTPSRTGRVTQWLLQTGNKAFIPISPPPPGKPWTEKSASAFRIRSRTLSGSTAVSSAPSTTTTTGLCPTTPSSRGTQELNLNLPSEKDLDTFPSRTLFSSPTPAISSTSISISTPTPDDRPYPTIYEGQQQHFAYSELDYYTSTNHRQSTIGLAF